MSSKLDQIVAAVSGLEPGGFAEISAVGADDSDGVFVNRFSDGQLTLATNLDDEPSVHAVFEAAHMVGTGDVGMYAAPAGVTLTDHDAAVVIDQVLVALNGADYTLDIS